MKNRIKQRQRQNRSIRAMQNKKQNLEVGQRVYVDFLSSNSVETDGTRISGFGVLDRVEPDGFVCGRLDIGQPFGCPSEYVQLETKVIGGDLGEEQPKADFATGDFVVLVEEGTKDWLLQIIDHMYTKDMYRVKILSTGQCGPLFKKGMRHATSEEIAAGHRIGELKNGLRRQAFEETLKASASYQKLVFMHGEKLFIFDEGMYKIASVQLAWEIYCEQQAVIIDLQGTVKEYSGWINDLKHERGFLQQVCAQRADTIGDLEKVFEKTIELVDLEIETVERSRNNAVDMQERNYSAAMLYFLRPIRRQLDKSFNLKMQAIKKDSEEYLEHKEAIDKSVPAAILEATEKCRGDKC
ncbi:hypothetical protein [Acinetobacter baumannii]|uniref:hypothetical protein n=1 Tax=Acinetobacter baumannii TaxID=470 RepID=UPI001D197379|nr:hypothetical protein [Acinetobacter baumannii]